MTGQCTKENDNEKDKTMKPVKNLKSPPPLREGPKMVRCDQAWELNHHVMELGVIQYVKVNTSFNESECTKNMSLANRKYFWLTYMYLTYVWWVHSKQFADQVQIYKVD